MRQLRLPFAMMVFGAAFTPYFSAADTLEEKGACAVEVLRRAPDIKAAFLAPAPRRWTIDLTVLLKTAPQMSWHVYVSNLSGRFYFNHDLQNYGVLAPTTVAIFGLVEKRCSLLDGAQVTERASPFGSVVPDVMVGPIDLNALVVPSLLQ